MDSSINYEQTEVVMADNNTENVADLSNIAAYNDYDESGESDLEDLNGEERTDMPADGDSGGEENTRGYHIHKRLLTTNRIVNSMMLVLR